MEEDKGTKESVVYRTEMNDGKRGEGNQNRKLMGIKSPDSRPPTPPSAANFQALVFIFLPNEYNTFPRA
jgi:hypothetical protein